MSIKVAAPRHYWDDPSGPVQELKTWLTLFNGWLEIQNLDWQTPLNDYQKNNLLLLSLGSEGMKIFHMDNIQVLNYKNFSTAVKETFIIPVNPVRAHYDLFHRRQQSSESVSEFLSSLRTLTADCQFCAECNKLMLATMLVVGCSNPVTQEKLLTEKTIDFEKIVSVLKAEELAREASTHLQSSSQVNKNSQNNRQTSSKKGNARNPQDTREKDSQGQGPKKTLHKACGTVHEKYRCPAITVTCFHCQGKGHFANKCPNKDAAEKGQQPRQHGRISALSLTVGTFASVKAYTCEVTVSAGADSLQYTAEVDSGSDVTTVTEAQYQSSFRDQSLSPLPPSVNIRNFDKSVIPIIGTFKAMVSFHGRSAEFTIYVVPNGSQAVLGKDAMHGLELQLNTQSFQVSTATAQILVSEQCFLRSKMAKTFRFPSHRGRSNLQKETTQRNVGSIPFLNHYSKSSRVPSCLGYT